MDDPYLIPGTNTFRNKFNIQDPKKVQDLETTIYFSKKLINLLPEGQFNYQHLKDIHRHLFGELYDWAGQERTIDIFKGHSHFARKEFIEKELNKIFLKLKEDKYLQELAQPVFCKKLSFYFNEINAAHPFREGNGRSLRAFCDLLSKKAGYNLVWRKVDVKEYTEASIRGFNGDYEAMEKIFSNITTSISRAKETQISLGKSQVNGVINSSVQVVEKIDNKKLLSKEERTISNFMSHYQKYKNLEPPNNQQEAQKKEAMLKSMGKMATFIEASTVLKKVSEQHNITKALSSCIREYDEYQKERSKVNLLMTELKSTNPIQDYLKACQQKEQLIPPWKTDVIVEKEQWRSLNDRIQKLAFIIDKSIPLHYGAKEIGIYDKVKGHALDAQTKIIQKVALAQGNDIGM